jgi:hypothetical protein
MRLVGPKDLERLSADLKDVGKIQTLELVEGKDLELQNLTFSELPAAE